MPDEFGSAVVDTVAMNEQIGEMMGPAKWMVDILSGPLSSAGVEAAWVLAAVANILMLTILVKRLFNITGYWVFLINGLWSFFYALGQYLPDWGAVVMATLGCTVVTIVGSQASGLVGRAGRKGQEKVLGQKLKPRGAGHRLIDQPETPEKEPE